VAASLTDGGLRTGCLPRTAVVPGESSMNGS
jgi:hypothetical protein